MCDAPRLEPAPRRPHTGSSPCGSSNFSGRAPHFTVAQKNTATPARIRDHPGPAPRLAIVSPRRREDSCPAKFSVLHKLI